jgi:murein tripeptide amidase MpaA
MFLDIHGDEELPFNFLAGSQGIPSWSRRLEYLLQEFGESYAASSRYMQVGYGYDNDDPGDANLAIGCDQMAERFSCLSATMEMPYKDVAAEFDAEFGWSADKCVELGASTLDAIHKVMPILREDLTERIAKQGDAAPWVKPSYKCPEWKEIPSWC